jgi:divalent metal cation (Fe/Co/Zn/Cd) transporter
MKSMMSLGIVALALLLGLSLNAAFDWWWADPIAGLTMVPWLLKEGQEALRGEVRCE